MFTFLIYPRDEFLEVWIISVVSQNVLSQLSAQNKRQNVLSQMSAQNKMQMLWYLVCWNIIDLLSFNQSKWKDHNVEKKNFPRRKILGLRKQWQVHLETEIEHWSEILISVLGHKSEISLDPSYLDIRITISIWVFGPSYCSSMSLWSQLLRVWCCWY